MARARTATSQKVGSALILLGIFLTVETKPGMGHVLSFAVSAIGFLICVNTPFNAPRQEDPPNPPPPSR